MCRMSRTSTPPPPHTLLIIPHLLLPSHQPECLLHPCSLIGTSPHLRTPRCTSARHPPVSPPSGADQLPGTGTASRLPGNRSLYCAAHSCASSRCTVQHTAAHHCSILHYGTVHSTIFPPGATQGLPPVPQHPHPPHDFLRQTLLVDTFGIAG